MAQKDQRFFAMAKKLLFLSPDERKEFDAMAEDYCRESNIAKRS